MTEQDSTTWDIQMLGGWPEQLPRDVADSWDRLACGSEEPTIFQDRRFVTLWCQQKLAVSGGKFLLCHAKGSDTGAEVVLPMVQLPRVSHSLWTKRLLAAGEPNFDFQDPLVSSVEEFSNARQSFWKAFQLILRREGFSRFTIARTADRFMPHDAQPDESEQSWKTGLEGVSSLDEFLSGRSGNLRGDVNRRMRRFNEVGPVEFHIFRAGEIDQAMLEFDELRQAYEDLWKGKPAEGLFRRPGIESWYRALIREFLPSGVLHFSRLVCGGQAVAWHFGFLHHRTLHWYKPTYRKQFSNLSPGKVLLAKVIEEGCRKGWRAVDYGPGMEPYKCQWATESSAMFRWEWCSERGIPGLINGLRRPRLARQSSERRR